MIELNATHTSRLAVQDKDTAIALGSGDMPVLATPAMLALMENAAMLAVQPMLEEGQTTVGSQISSSHLKPSPVGAQVEATALLTAIDGRKLTFTVECHQGDTLLGSGTHTRFIVDRQRFLSKL